MQKWRRGGGKMPHSPKTFGNAIDDCIRILRGMDDKNFMETIGTTKKYKDSMNSLASRSCYNALKRNKTSVFNEHDDDVNGIKAEVNEFLLASEHKKSEHLPDYTEAQEELADVLICCMTELFKRGVNVDDIVRQKIAFNESRV